MTTHTDHDMSEHPGLDEPRPGHELRVARERAGISRESMAERLRLAVAQFDALEHDDYTELPPPAFVRGYFRAYARELGLDSDAYVDAYNRSGVSSRDPEIRRGGVTDTASGGRGGMIGLLLIALVAAGGIGAWWYQQRMVDDSSGSGSAVDEERVGANGADTGEDPQEDTAGGDTDTGDSGSATDDGDEGAVAGDGDRDADDVSATADDAETDSNGEPNGDSNGDTDTESASVDVEAAAATVAAEDGGGDEAEQPTVAVPDRESPETGADGSAGDGSGIAEAGDPDSGSGTEEDADNDAATVAEGSENDGAESAANDEPGATSPAATDSPTRVATEAAGTGPDEITLEFSARSWLEVYDDRERELAYTLYFGSEPVTLQGWAPFEIFLGNSPAVDVQFNGEGIDKSAFTRSNNTARFVVDAAGVRAP